MAVNFKKPSKKTTIIAAIGLIILLAIAITGTVVFLKDRGTTEAADLDQVNRQQTTTGATSTEANSNAGQTVEGQNANVENQGAENLGVEGTVDGTTDTDTGTTGTVATTPVAGTTTTGGTGATGTTTTTVDGIQDATIIDNQVVVTENPWETHEVTWRPISVKAELASANINAQKSDFKIEKTAKTTSGENIAKPGEEITYTIKVTSNKELKNIDVKDTIPEKTEYVSSSDGARLVKDGETVKGVIWNVDLSEKNGQYEKTLELKVKVNATEGTIENIAIANGKTSETEEGGTKTAIINPTKISEISRNGKKVTSPAKVNDEITYTISVKNTGEIAGKTTIKDKDLENILSDEKAELVGKIELYEGTTLKKSDITAENLIEGIEDVEVPAGKEVKVVFTIKLNKIEGKIVNTATIGEDENDKPTDEIDTVNITAEKHTEQKTVKVGENITYTIELKNSGSKEGTITVKDPKPEGTKFTSAKLITADGETEITETTLQSGKNVTVPANGKIEIEVVVTAVAKTSKNTDTTSVTNTAYIKEDPNKPEEPVPSEEVKVANVKATKTSSYEGELKEKSVITYTIELTNVGKADGTVKITDQIPEGTTFVEGSIKVNGEGNYALADLTTNGINVTVAKDNGTAKVTFQVTVNPFEGATKHIINAEAKKDEEPVNPTDDTAEKEYVNIDVEKIWKDPNGTKHNTITINLLRDEKPVNSIELKNGATKYTFSKLDKYDLNDGHEYTYSVSENEVSGYQVAYGQKEDRTLTITNTIDQETISKSGTKTWKAPEGAELPEITVNLLRDGKEFGRPQTLASGATEYTFEGLDRYDLTDGHEYVYTVSETGAEGTYDTEVDGMNLINTIKQEKTRKSGTKTWKAPSNATIPEITVSLLRDGTPTGETRTLSNRENTTYTFDNLDRYDLTDGHEYVYTVSETGAEGTYDTEVDGMNLTNTIKQEKTSKSGTKTWKAPEGAELPTITVSLLRNGTPTGETRILTSGNTEYTFDGLDKYDLSTGHEYIYTVSETGAEEAFTTEVDGMNLTNTIKQDETSVSVEKIWNDPYTTHPSITIQLLRNNQAFGEPVTLTNKTEYTFTKLEKYDLSTGHEYEYTVREMFEDGVLAVDGYQTPVYGQKEDGTLTITNTIIQEKISVNVEKIWKGPVETRSPITVKLLRDTDEFVTSTVLTSDTTYTFPNLDKYAPDGHIYNYYVRETAEDGVSGVSGYQTPVYGQKEDGTLTITNTINPGTTSVSGTKTWNVPEGTTEYPPIKINLFKNETLETSTQLTDGATEYTFPGLVEYDENGEKYKYTVTETPVTGYISEQDGFNFTNTKIVPEIEVTKVISAVNGTPVTAADNIGSDEAKLNKDAIITYTITTKNTGNTTLSEVKIFDDKKVDLIEATLPTRLQNLTDEQGNPTPVVIELRNGITANTNLLGRDDLTLEPNEEIVLKVSYQLQKEDVLGGKDFVNTAKAVGKYDNKSYNDDDDATVKTEFVPDKVSKTAEKIWDDKNYESNRPTEIKVQLMKNGNPEGTKVTLNENNGWKYTWPPLPEEDAKGTAIDYSVVEDALADYTTSYGKKADGTMTITNTYKKPVSQEGQITITRNETSPQTIQVPMDVVFILDTSGSMVQGDSNNRAKNMVEAVNKTATTILGYNDYNRISVVGFSGSYEGKHQNSTDVTTLLSLGRYTAKSSSGKGANKVNNYLNLTTSGSGNKRYGELTTNVNGTSASRYVNGGTYTQIGIAEGAKQLISASDKTVTLDDGTVVKRIPVIILLSDGEPTYYTTNYKEVTSTGRTGEGVSSTAEYGYNTVLSANYYKNRVTAQYGKTAMMYTIGMGISRRDSNNPGNYLYERLVLDPSGQNVTDAKYPKYEKPNTLITLLENDKNGYANNYSYADKAYFGEMNASDLTAKMQESIDASIPKITERAITSEEIKNAKVVLTNINKEGEFTLTDGVTTYSSFSSAQAAGVIAGNDTTGYYIDLTKVSAGSIVRVSYTS